MSDAPQVTHFADDVTLARLMRLERENAELRTVLGKLVHKLHECDPYIANAFMLNQIRGGKYTGPNYADELLAAEQALVKCA